MPGSRAPRLEPGRSESAPGQSLQKRGRRTWIAVEAQVVRPHGVQHDQEHVRRAGGRQGTALFAPLLDPVAAEDPARLEQDQPQQDGNAQRQQAPRAGRMPFQQRGHAQRDPQRDQQPRFQVDPRAGHHQHAGRRPGERSAADSTIPPDGARVASPGPAIPQSPGIAPD